MSFCWSLFFSGRVCVCLGCFLLNKIFTFAEIDAADSVVVSPYFISRSGSNQDDIIDSTHVISLIVVGCVYRQFNVD